MKKLFSLVENYFTSNDMTVQKFINKDKLPVYPLDKWEKIENKKYVKQFTFKDLGKRNLFMLQIFRNERLTCHCADISIKEFDVVFEVYTRGINLITEMDDEYIRDVDMIYKDILNMR